MIIVQFIKKQLLLIMRNPQILLILIGMPLILITILGFALGNVMSGEEVSVKAKVAIIEHGDSEQELSLFLKELESSTLPPETWEAVSQSAQRLMPVELLRSEVLKNPELKKYISVDEVEPGDLEKTKEDDSYSAIIEIPEGFSAQILSFMFLKGEVKPELKLYRNEGRELTSNLVEDLLTGFQEQYSLAAIIGRSSDSMLNTESRETEVEGAVASVEDREPLTSMTYYAVGMSVMFVLYIASNMGSFAYQEKEDHVFDRMILANVPVWKYFISILMTTVILALLQLGILFGICALFYGVTWPDIRSFILVTIALSLAVGSIGALLTSLNYRANSEAFSNFFSTVAVTIFAFIGGSFGELFSSDFIQSIGAFTPNGAGMAAYFKLFQGYTLSGVYSEMLTLLVLSLIILGVAALLFPKKGGTAK
ncbi:ABC transporter permease [Bacillus sp. Marseille-Q1617]|uniref:ABC transporter permease n=1 Tax=Bacillus sp. Marseille-Q1617 TaxID=2736887 RepID=UPI00158E5363|nr:ABC transporter permease [Bacillus sp. Marseille-Q1617]